MSKQNNQNRDSYEQAGRDRQSEPRLHEQDKEAYGERMHETREGSRNFIPGASPVGEKEEKK
jgi:hypothetical protein